MGEGVWGDACFGYHFSFLPIRLKIVGNQGFTLTAFLGFTPDLPRGCHSGNPIQVRYQAALHPDLPPILSNIVSHLFLRAKIGKKGENRW